MKTVSAVSELIPARHSGLARLLIVAFALQAHVHLGADAVRAQVPRQGDLEASLAGMPRKVAAAIRADPTVAAEFLKHESFRKDLASMGSDGKLRLIEAFRSRERDKDPNQDASVIKNAAAMGATIGFLVGAMTPLLVHGGPLWVPVIGAGVGAALGRYYTHWSRSTADARYEASRQRLLTDFERDPASARKPALPQSANRPQTDRSAGEAGPSFEELPIR